MAQELTSRAPGRICLFGEHQDYMGLPVIAAAIDLAITVTGEVGEGDRIELTLPDLGVEERFSFADAPYRGPRDYLRSSLRVLLDRGLLAKPLSIRATVRGTIPIQAGASSSSALITAWIAFLLGAAQREEVGDPNLIARLAFQAEVSEFGESGGMMDHLASALGGILFLDFSRNPLQTHTLPPLSGHFILGDSGEPKPTLRTITRIRKGQEAALLAARPHLPPVGHCSEFPPWEVVKPLVKGHLSTELFPYLRAVLLNREITLTARNLLEQRGVSPQAIALQMNRLQELMRGDLNLSTPRLDRLISSALAAGALGAKINGSGEGGCMLAYCREKDSEQVVEAIRRAGGTPHLLRLGKGVEVSSP